MDLKYLLFCLSINLLGVKDFETNLTDQKCVKGNLMLQFSWLEEFHLEKVSG